MLAIRKGLTEHESKAKAAGAPPPSPPHEASDDGSSAVVVDALDFANGRVKVAN